MALVSCPECNREVSDKAKACPNCGYENNNQIVESQDQPQKKKGKSKWSNWLTVLIIFVFLYLISSMGDSGSQSSSSGGSNDKFLAYNYATDYVKKELKSPGTAEFPGVLEKEKHITSLGGNKYRIESWVDSQNSFGAKIRTKFSCVIEFGGNKVKCTDLQFH